MPYLNGPGGRLFYTDEGSGPTIVLVHGWACDSTDWTWMLAELEGKGRLVAYDRRGHGRSEVAEDCTLARQVEDLVHLIAQLGLDRPVVVGHSAGGVVASALAVERPDLVRGIAVLDPPYAADEAGQAGADAAGARLATGEWREVALSFFERCYGPGTPRWFPTLVRRRLEALAPSVALGDFHAVWSHPEGIARSPTSEAYLSRRACPVLAIHSTRQLAELERSSFADERSRAIDWPGSGHWINVERAAECAALVTEWGAAL